MNKKGFTMPEILVGLVVMVIFFLWWAGVFTPTAAEAGQIFSSEILKAKESKCLLDTQRELSEGLVLNEANDRDGDGLKDKCDTCVCSSSSCKNTPENRESSTGLPLGCIKYDSKGKPRGCKFTVTDGRCVEGAPSPIKKG